MGYGREARLVVPKLPDDENPCKYSSTIAILGASSHTHLIKISEKRPGKVSI